jgi:hypothetical protein
MVRTGEAFFKIRANGDQHRGGVAGAEKAGKTGKSPVDPKDGVSEMWEKAEGNS